MLQGTSIEDLDCIQLLPHLKTFQTIDTLLWTWLLFLLEMFQAVMHVSQ